MTLEPVHPTLDERELLLRFLHRQREEVVASATALTEEQARWTPDGGLLPIIGVINHLSHVEWRWIDGRCLGSTFPLREDEFSVSDDVSLAEVIATCWARSKRQSGSSSRLRASTSPVLALKEICQRPTSCSDSVDHWISGGFSCT